MNKSILVISLIVLMGCSQGVIDRPGPMGPAGVDGTNGVDGATGPTGANGQGCSVTELDVSVSAPNGGAVIQCGTDVPVVVKNGTNGVSSAYSVTKVIDPCGASGSHDEVFLCLNNGDVLSSFSENANGKNTRFTILQSGSGYVTTDASGCVFSAARTGNGTGTTTLMYSNSVDVCVDNSSQ